MWKIPPTLPQKLAISAISLPSLILGASSLLSKPANLGNLTASTCFFRSIAFRRTRHLVSLKIEVTSTKSSFMLSILEPSSLSSFLISRRLSWRRTSLSIIFDTNSSSWTPFISISAPSLMETFRSWRIAPRPRLTLRVARRIRPIAKAVFSASSGV